MADSSATLADMGAVRAAKATKKVLMEERQRRKLVRLAEEAKAAERKAIASKRALEIEARKRAKGLKTVRSYFLSSRNSLNHAPLECATKEADTSASVGCSQFVDTEIVLSCPAVVSLSEEDEVSEDEPDLSGDDMVDSDDDAFIDPPSRGGWKRKGRDRRLKSAKGAGASTTGTLKKFKRDYDLHRKFQCDWAAKEP